jgi:uncharacterized protein YggE
MKPHLIFAAVLIFSFSGILAQNDESKLIVQGEAILYDIPENVHVQIPIAAKDISYQACSEKLMNSYNALSKALEKKGIDPKEIKAGRVSISENYSYSDGSRKQDGFVGTLLASLEISHTEKSLNNIMNTLKEEQFNFGYTLSFQLSEEQKSNLKSAAIKLAIIDAKTKAEVIAESLGLKLVAVHEVIFGGVESGPDPLFGRHDYALMKTNANEDVQVELNPEKIEIRKYITIHWRMSK